MSEYGWTARVVQRGPENLGRPADQRLEGNHAQGSGARGPRHGSCSSRTGIMGPASRREAGETRCRTRQITAGRRPALGPVSALSPLTLYRKAS